MTPLTPSPTPNSLQQYAYDAIKAAILDFTCQPGSGLVEADLARQLGMSKTPVREALGRLEREGFVFKIPYTGYLVVPISQHTMHEIFQIRAALEGLSARMAAERFSPRAAALAVEFLEEHARAARTGDIVRAAKFNRHFHGLLIECAQNQHLGQILFNLDEHLQRYRLLASFQKGRLEKSIAEHQRILAALQAGNPDEAEAAARAHILGVAADLRDQDFDTLIAQVAARIALPE